jgi:hypothetical protein
LLPLRVRPGETYAAFRSIVGTAKANGGSVYDTIRFVLSAKRPAEAVAGMRCNYLKSRPVPVQPMGSTFLNTTDWSLHCSASYAYRLRQ